MSSFYPSAPPPFTSSSHPCGCLTVARWLLHLQTSIHTPGRKKETESNEKTKLSQKHPADFFFRHIGWNCVAWTILAAKNYRICLICWNLDSWQCCWYRKKQEWPYGRQLEVASKAFSGQNSSIEKQHWNKVDALTWGGGGQIDPPTPSLAWPLPFPNDSRRYS